VRTIFLGAILGVSLLASRASAAPSVWAVDDGEKVRRDAIDTRFERGQENPVWRPGEPARLFAMKNESVAMQVVVEADDVQLRDVSVDLQVLDGPDGTWLGAAGVSSQVARPIERFVEHFGAGKLPDALVPVEHTPSWAPYPLVVDPRSNGIVWIDVNVPRDQRAGTYRGAVHVHSGNIEIGTLPVELDVDLPGEVEMPVSAAVYFAVAEALANAARHSGARTVRIHLRHAAGTLRAQVTDDGAGGADPAAGTGLAGVERRLATFDGILAVSSPPGGPTIVAIEVPCALSSAKTSSC